MTGSEKRSSDILASSSSSQETDETQLPPIPDIYKCAISGRLMQDPAFLYPIGLFVEKVIFNACKDLDYVPPAISSSSYSTRPLSSFSLSPSPFTQQAIVAMCQQRGLRPPDTFPLLQAALFVKRLKKQRPSSSAYAGQSHQSRIPRRAAEAHASSDAARPLEEKDILRMLSGPTAERQKFALISIAKASVTLCTPRIMSAIVPMLSDNFLRTRATQTLKVLSQAQGNRILMVASGVVTPLFSILDYSQTTWCENAAAILCNLAKDDANKLPMGRLQAIPRLLEKLFDNISYIARESVALALFYLTLSSTTLSCELASMEAVPKLLEMAAAEPNVQNTIALRRYVVSILYNLSYFSEKAREDMLVIGGGVVDLMLRLLGEGAETERYCLGVMLNLCQYRPVEFRKLALAAGAQAVLAVPKEEWEDDGRDMAKAMLKSLSVADDSVALAVPRDQPDV